MRMFRLVSAALILVGIALNYVGATPDPAIGPLRRVVTFFSFFTILTNCLMVAMLVLPEIAPETWAGRALARPSVRGGIVVYAVMAGLIYVLILRHLWAPQGLMALGDRIVHYAAPVIAVLDWVVLVPRGKTRWTDAVWWLLFPLAYGVYTLAHGAMTGFYPYPFVNATELGFDSVLGHFALFLVGFLVLGLAIVLIDRIEARRPSPGPRRGTR